MDSLRSTGRGSRRAPGGGRTAELAESGGKRGCSGDGSSSAGAKRLLSTEADEAASRFGAALLDHVDLLGRFPVAGTQAGPQPHTCFIESTKKSFRLRSFISVTDRQQLGS